MSQDTSEALVAAQAKRITELRRDIAKYEASIDAIENKASELEASFCIVVKAIKESDGVRDAWETFIETAKDLDRGPKKTPELHAMLNHPEIQKLILGD